MNIPTPFQYSKSFLIKEKLNRLVPNGYRVFYNHFSTNAYSNLITKTINLPFVEPLEINDELILLEHELGHFKTTKEPAIINYERYSITKALYTINILEDIIINEKLNRRKLETTLKNLALAKGDDIAKDTARLTITLWEHFSKKEKEETIKKSNIFKDEIETEKIIKIINETIESRKKYNSLKKWMKEEETIFEEYYNLFKDNDNDYIKADGPGVLDEEVYLPDWVLMKNILKIVRNLKTITIQYWKKEQFYGKKLNRNFIEKLSTIKPFTYHKTTKEINTPKPLILLDLSGSMGGTPIKIAKAIAIAILEVIPETIVAAKNDLTFVVTQNKDVIIKLEVGGDEGFETLPFDFNKINLNSIDFFILLTDLNIDREEIKGLIDFSKKLPTKIKKYILSNYKTGIEELNKEFKIINIDEQDKVINFFKKLVGNFS